MTRPVFLSCTYSACPDPALAELLELRGYLLIMKNGLTALQLACELKYSPDQPRWPAGDPRGGQWMPKEGGEGEDNGRADSTGDLAANDGTPASNQAQKISKFRMLLEFLA